MTFLTNKLSVEIRMERKEGERHRRDYNTRLNEFKVDART